MVESMTFWELPELIVAVSPRSGSASFARSYPKAVKINPKRDAHKFDEKGCVYFMRNPVSRVVSAYKYFVFNPEGKHSPPKGVSRDIEKFVDYCARHQNPHWSPVFPWLSFVTEIRPLTRLGELVGDLHENKSKPLSVFLNHDTIAKIAYHWNQDIAVYNNIEQK